MNINNQKVRVGTCWLVESPMQNRALFAFRVNAQLTSGWDGVFYTKEGICIKLVEIKPIFAGCLTNQITISKEAKIFPISKAKFNMIWDMTEKDED